MSLIPHSLALRAGPRPTRLLAQRHQSRSVGRGYAENMAEPFDPVSELSALGSFVSQRQTNAGAAKNPSPRGPCHAPVKRVSLRGAGLIRFEHGRIGLQLLQGWSPSKGAGHAVETPAAQGLQRARLSRAP